jgi:hypothetical protein
MFSGFVSGVWNGFTGLVSGFFDEPRLQDVIDDGNGLSLTAGTPAVNATNEIDVLSASLSLVAGPPTVNATAEIDALSAVLSLAAGTSVVNATNEIDALSASLSLIAGLPEVSTSNSIQALSASLALVAGLPTVNATNEIDALFASLSLTAGLPLVGVVIEATSAALGLSAGMPEIQRQVFITKTNPAPNLLVKSLELPLPIEFTESKGIHQSDIIFQSSLNAALADLRANPVLLNYVWAQLPQDELTWKSYGQKSLDEAKKWFLSTNIPVFVDPHMTEGIYPNITITLMESAEVPAEATLGDIHEPSAETNNMTWPSLSEPVTPSSYFPSTGIVTFKNAIPLAVDCFLMDHSGRSHRILEVLSDTQCRISIGTVADFRNTIVKSFNPGWTVALESSSFRESYRIGIHVPSDPVHAVWLHSIVVFCLLRYKQALLEARGFERSTFQSSDFSASPEYGAEGGEPIWGRHITVSGYVRQYWPKAITERIIAVNMDPLTVSGAYHGDPGVRPNFTPGPDVTLAKTGVKPDDTLWAGNRDSLSKPRR